VADGDKKMKLFSIAEKKNSSGQSSFRTLENVVFECPIPTIRAARFFSYKIPKQEKCTKRTQNVLNGHRYNIPKVLKILQMYIKYKKFQSKALQNVPKFGFLV
jgi:hypothetical protein